VLLERPTTKDQQSFLVVGRSSVNGLLAGRLALLGAGTLWSLGGVGIKSLALGAILIAGYRCLFAAVAVLPWGVRDALCEARSAGLPRGELGVSIALYAAMLGTYVAAVQGTTAANANLLQYTAPLHVLLFTPLLLGEPVRRADRRAIAVSLVGIAVLFLGNWRGAEARGLVLGLGSGLLFGLFMVWQRRLRGCRPVAIVFLNNLGAALLLLPLAGSSLALDPRSLAILVFLGAVQFALPYVLFTWSLQRVEGPEASLLTLVEPVLTPIWAALILREHPTAATVVGGACILAALALRYLKNDPRQRVPTHDP
jgi:drug/metabolite transporter (DMT)-like permease